MKVFMAIISSIAFSWTLSYAQEIKPLQVPQAVRTVFQKTHPDIKKVAWEKEDANFEAGFKANGTEISVLFDASGKLLETETEIPESALPAAVSSALASAYSDFEIEEVSRIEAEGQVNYEVEIEKKEGKEEKELELLFSPEGQILKKTKSEEDDEQKDEGDEDGNN